MTFHRDLKLVSQAKKVPMQWQLLSSEPFCIEVRLTHPLGTWGWGKGRITSNTCLLLDS